MKGVDQEIKELIDLNASLEDVIAAFTEYIIDNYYRLRKEVIKELAEEYY